MYYITIAQKIQVEFRQNKSAKCQLVGVCNVCVLLQISQIILLLAQYAT